MIMVPRALEGHIIAHRLTIVVVLGIIAWTPVLDASSPPYPGMHHPVPDTAMERPLPPTYPPPGNILVSPGEFCRADGVILTYETAFSSTDIIVDLAYVVAQQDTVYMICKSGTTRSQAIAELTAAGVDMDRVRFIIYPQLSDNSIWVRDYGPVYLCEDGDKAIADFWYPFTSDDDVPIAIGAEFGLPVYTNDLLHSGGNFMTDGNGMGFATEIVYEYNSSYTHAEVRSIFRSYCGIDSLVVLPKLDVENTKHIDVFCKLLDDTTFIVGEYAAPGDGAGNNYYILNDIAAQLDTLRNLDGREFDVVRIPMPPYEGGGWAPTRTYTNSLLVNDRAVVPVYGQETDDEALQIYQSILPDYEIIGFDSEEIIQRAGAVHCISKLHHSDNPLIVFHASLSSVPANEEVPVAFRVNPGFPNTFASVYYRPESEEDFVEVPAAIQNGVWQAVLPPMYEDFEYYLAATASCGGHEFPVALPADAPSSTIAVEVTGTAHVDVADRPRLDLRAQPSLIRSTTQLRFQLAEAGDANLAIYDSRGRLVRTFAPLRSEDGVVHWDGSDHRLRRVSRGVYFCHLRSRDRIATVKLLLVE
jgi:agmatine/peptidylarginine deiminase